MAEFLAIFDVERVRRNPRVFRDRPGIIEDFRDRELIARYRLDRASILELVDLLHDDLVAKTDRSHPVSPTLQVLTGLRYLAKGDFFSEVSDIHGISKATGARLFNKFVDSVNRHVDNIKFPTSEDEVKSTKIGFFQIARLPGCLGAIDGTLIPIIAPRRDSHAYICRKNFHALNIQAVADSNMRFTDVVARWPGSQHDSAIWNACGLKVHMEGQRNCFLLGDSGYALRPYLMTPVLNPSTPAELAYNQRHARTRVVVERAFGVLKSRFRCLHKSGGCLPFQPEKCCKVVLACMRLHNMCIENNIPEPEQCVQTNDVCNAHVNADANASGMNIRRGIINMFA